MASIRKELDIAVDITKAWAALRSVGDAHRAFAPVLADARLDGDMRTATFGNGMVVHERILDIDDLDHRVAYAVTDAPGVEYHHASMELVDGVPGHCRFIWITDVYPSEATSMVEPLIEAGAKALKKNLEDQGR